MSIRNRLAAALLCTTMLTAPAHADPITAFIGGALNALGVGTWLASGAVGAWSAGFTAGSWLGGTVIGRAVLGVGLSAAINSVARADVPSPSDRQVNYAQPMSYMERGYGRVKKGGPLAFTAYHNAGKKRHYGVLIAAHRTKGPVEHYLDKWQVSIDGAGAVTTAPADGYGAIKAYRGTLTQVANADWIAAFPEVTSAHNFKGLSYAAVAAKKPKPKKFSKIYPSGREWQYSAVWDMDDDVYDPRDDARKWTDNAALIIARECERFGKSVDWSEVAAEAAICDQLVTNGDGGTQRRWTINGVLDDSMSWETVRAQLQLACDAWFYERLDGSVGFRVGRYIAPTVTLTDRDFLALDVAENAWGPDVQGEFAVQYIEPGRGYIETPSGAIVLAEDAPRLESSCFLIDSHNQACRVAKRIGLTTRPRFTVAGTVKLIGYELIGQRFVRIASTALGFDQVVEVGTLVRAAGGLSFELEAKSVDSDDFAFVAATEEPPRPAYVTVTEDDAVDVPVGLAVEVVEGDGGGALFAATWPAQDESLTQQIRYRSTAANVSAWRVIDADDDATSIALAAFRDGKAHEFQLRNKTASGKLSAWTPSPALTVTAVANTSPPGAVTGFAAVASGGDVSVSWSAPNDSRYWATRIYRSTDDPDFADAVLIRTEYGIPSSGDSYLDVAPGLGTHRYWAVPINASGVDGPRSGPQTVIFS